MDTTALLARAHDLSAPPAEAAEAAGDRGELGKHTTDISLPHIVLPNMGLAGVGKDLAAMSAAPQASPEDVAFV